MVILFIVALAIFGFLCFTVPDGFIGPRHIHSSATTHSAQPSAGIVFRF
jgi:hypothetical protein